MGTEVLPLQGRELAWHRAWVPGVLVLQWVGMCLLAWPVGDFPINDDWAYVPAIRTFLESGQIQIPKWAGMNFLGHLLWGAAFGVFLGVDHFTMRVAGMTAGLIAVLATYALCREVGGSRRMAGLAAAAFAANPIHFGVSASFMTDAPFLAAAVLSLWMYARALRQGSVAGEIAGTALAVLAILIRQTGLALPLAFALGYLWRHGLNLPSIVRSGSACVVAAASHLAWKLWMQAHGQVPAMYGLQAEQLKQTLQLGVGDAVAHIGSNLGAISVYAAISCAFPLFAAVLGKHAARESKRWITLVCILILGVSIYGIFKLTGVRMPLLGNQLTLDGLGPRLGTPRATGVLLWSGWSLVTLVAATAIAGALVYAGQWWWARGLAWRPGAASVLLAAFVGVSVAPVLLLHVLFDRYVLVLLPPLLALLTASTAGSVPAHHVTAAPAMVRASLALVVTLSSLFCGALAHDFFAINRTKWLVLDGLLTRGVPASHIDGGFEFNGKTKFDDRELKAGENGWWVQDGSIKVRYDLRPSYAQLERHTVGTILPFTPDTVYVMVKH